MNGHRLIDIPRFTEPRGSLSVIEGAPLLPFNPVRFFYIYGVPDWAERGGHALKTNQEFLVALSGSFWIRLDDGSTAEEYVLDRPDQGLYVPPLTWQLLHSFTPCAVCGVFASELYDEDGYYRVYEEFLEAVRRNGTR